MLRRINAKGVTLTELMVSMAGLGILTLDVSGFLIGGIKFYRLSTAKGEIQRDVRLAIDLVNRNLRQGLSNTVTISRFNADQPPCSLIQFTHIDGNEYRYYQLGNVFFAGKRPSGGTWQDSRMADNLRVLFFSYPRTDDDNIVSVSLCFEKATYQGSSKTLQLSVEKVRIMN
jgi:hypothetical protein